MTDQLPSVEHLVVLMLENRSFDHMLGFLYTDHDNLSPAGHPYDGLTGKESNPGPDGTPVTVFPIHPDHPHAYFMPGADPAEGYAATNDQLFGSPSAPVPPIAHNEGFVKDFATVLAHPRPGRPIVPGTVPGDIMGCYAPETLPVLSGLARGYAVCDRWFCPVPTETLPNRAFACAATSQGHMDDRTHTFAVASIFGLLTQHRIPWRIHGYTAQPLTRGNFPDTSSADPGHFGRFADFTAAAAAGALPAFTFLEPSWSSTGNSQHPNYDVALGEQLIHDTYRAVRTGAAWERTLLVITYDEHGGCYDHVAPPVDAVAPDSSTGEFGFDFTRLGPRVPAVLVSPLIEPGTVFRAPAGALDHTSILRTVQRRWALPALTLRDAAAPDFGGVLTRTRPRTDDPLDGVVVPASLGPNPAAGTLSHLAEVHAELTARGLIPAEPGEV
ncbi:alkaline phosphatase family protein [Streptomyces violascens]|uniref:alkaline phosphatase family protein n=1 Tax=Streptomyces violascens TaxID=67381 RepID=UPI0037B1D937